MLTIKHIESLDKPRDAATIAALASVILGAPKYSLMTNGKLPNPSEAENILTDVPPTISTDRVNLLGAYLGEEMIGYASILRGWNETNKALIGLLLLKESHQGRGFGAELFNATKVHIQRVWPEAVTLRIAVVQTNESAFPFWRKMGFLETGEVKATKQNPEYIAPIVILERPILL